MLNFAPRRRALRLSYNNIGDQGAIALASSRTLTQLTTLDLRHNRIGEGGITALLRGGVHIPRQASRELLDALDIKALKNVARGVGLRGYGRLDKGDLIEALVLS